jgi:hypothetical protein
MHRGGDGARESTREVAGRYHPASATIIPMKRGLICLLVLVLALPALATAAAPTSPSLRLLAASPLTLQGSGFRAGESVRVRLSVRTLAETRTLRSDQGGRFTFRHSGLLAVDPCRGTIVVSAVGAASGRSAMWKRACRPAHPLP